MSDLAPPEDVSAVMDDSGLITVTWSGWEDAIGYEVERSPDASDWASAASLPAGSGEFVDSAVTLGVSYLYRVAAVYDDGTSDWSAIAYAPVADGFEGDTIGQYISGVDVVLVVNGVSTAAEEVRMEFTAGRDEISNSQTRNYFTSTGTIRRVNVRATCIYVRDSPPAYDEGDLVELIAAVPDGPGVQGSFRIIKFMYPSLKAGEPIKYLVEAESTGPYMKSGMGG